MNSTTYQDVIIVGAGTSGLSVAYYLLEQGIKPLIIDAATEIASSWRKRHPQLSLNTHRKFSQLPGLDINKSFGAFVKRDHYIDYLEQYQAMLLDKHQCSIEFNTPVEKIDAAEFGWRVTANSKIHFTKNLVVATGPDRKPHLPSWPGLDSFEFESEVGKRTLVHAADFGPIEQYDGKRVLIVGGANSGIDLANHLIKRQAYGSLTISMRSGAHLMPTYVAGIPVHLIGPSLSKLPIKWQDYLARLFSVLCFGDLTKYGIKTPDQGLATRLQLSKVAPGFDQGFVSAVKKGEVSVVEDIERINAETVSFKGGEVLQVDSIICATGYRTGLEQILPEQCIGPNQRFHDLPGLWVFGMMPKLEGSLYARVGEAEVVAGNIVAAL